MKTLKERIQAALIYRASVAEPDEDISQASLARFCKITPVSVNNWFSGETKTMKAATALKAAAYLKVQADWLANNIGPMIKTDILQPLHLTMRRGVGRHALHLVGYDDKNVSPSSIYSLDGVTAMLRDGLQLPEEFLVRLTDEALAPKQRSGDLVRLSTRKSDLEQVAAGDGVLVSTGNGFSLLRLYKTKGDGTWSAESANPNFLPLHSRTDELTVLAVVVGAETTGKWSKG